MRGMDRPRVNAFELKCPNLIITKLGGSGRGSAFQAPINRQHGAVLTVATKRIEVHLPNVGFEADARFHNFQKTSVVVGVAPRPQPKHKNADNDPHRRPNDPRNAELYFVAIGFSNFIVHSIARASCFRTELYHAQIEPWSSPQRPLRMCRISHTNAPHQTALKGRTMKAHGKRSAALGHARRFLGSL